MCEHADVGHGEIGRAGVLILGRPDFVAGEGGVVEGAVHGTHVPHFHRGWLLLVDGRDGILDGLVGDVLFMAFVMGILGLEGVVLSIEELAVAEIALGGLG